MKRTGTQWRDHKKSPPGQDGSSTVNEIYIKYNDGLRRYLRRRLSSREEVDVVSQEVYLRLIRHNKLDGLKPSLPLLCTIAANLIKDRIRKKKVREKYLQALSEDAELTSQLRSPEEKVMSIEGIEHFKQFFKTLNKDCQQAFVLHRLKGLTYEEIAKKMRISKSMVYKHLSHAILQIMKKFGNEI